LRAFSLTAATRVCSGGGLAELDILDLVSSLVDKSLIVPEIGVDAERFRLIESTREYALDKLDQSGERRRVAQAHASYFCDVALSLDSERAADTSPRFDADGDNYRSALSWALDQRNDVLLGARLVGLLAPFWSPGPRVEGLRWATAALDVLGSNIPDDVGARLWSIVAELSDGQRSFEASRHAVALNRHLGDAQYLASALYFLGFAAYQLGKYEEAETAYREALTVAREAGDERRVATSLNGLASALFMRGDIDGPRRCYDEALAVHAATGNDNGRSAVLGNLAELEFAQGDVEKAITHAVEGLDIELRFNRASAKAVCLNNLCAYRARLGELERARADGREGLRYALESQSSLYTMWSLQNLALLGALNGDARRAAQVLGYVERLYQEEGAEREPTELWTYEQVTAALRALLSKSDEQALKAQGASWSLERASKEAFEL